MTKPLRRIQIALVGFDYDRILKPIVDVPPNKLYIFYDNKKDDYGRLSKRFATQVNRKVEGIIQTEMIGFNPWDFKDCFENIMKVFLEERDSEITVNISSSTNLAVAAAVYAASIFKARIVYVKGEYKELPKEMKKASAARDTSQFIDPFTPTELGRSELDILSALFRSGGSCESLTHLTKTMRLSRGRTTIKDIRKDRAELSYKVRKLERLGFVRRDQTGSRNRVPVSLTDAGEVMGKLMMVNNKNVSDR